MAMIAAPEVSVRRLPAAPDEAPRAEVLITGRPTGWRIAGAVLEAAVRCDEKLLLFLTDDVPHEDCLSIHLLDANGNMLDSARLGSAYTTGTFDALLLEPPDHARFRFFGGIEWTLRVLPKPGWRLPLVRDAPGVHRAWGLRRHFVVRGKPRPATPH
jgi:hypothetical protein